jgi:membrane-associated phospholipid phosphatase
MLLILGSCSVQAAEMPHPFRGSMAYLKWYLGHYTSSWKHSLSWRVNAPFFITGAVTIPLTFVFDHKVQQHVVENPLYSQSVSQLGFYYGQPWGYVGGLALVSVTGLVTRQSFRKTLAQIQLIGESVITTSAVTLLLKEITHRERPNGTCCTSFPSGHSSCTFALATALHEIYGDIPGAIFYAIAAFVASSRINDNKHYLSDVTAGAVLGIVIGRGFARQYRSEWELEVKPDPTGLSINLRWRL